MASVDKECQDDELIALSSIYDERMFSKFESGGKIEILLEIPYDFKIKISKNSYLNINGCDDDDIIWDIFPVKFLPPLVLNFFFPSCYPSQLPPKFTLNCQWLNQEQLSSLCKSLDLLWEESPCEVILFRWIQFLQEDTLESLNISSPLILNCQEVNKRHGCVDIRAIQNVSSVSILLNEILCFDQEEKTRAFDLSYFTCRICFSEKSGASCIKFPKCEHVFCCECVSEYFKVQIESGLVKALNCPETDCDSQALPSQVKKLVSPDLFAKYDKYLLQISLNEMSDLVYCPRPSCQSPVILEKDTTMGVCGICHFAFCSLCKLTYHGISPCVFKENEIRKLKQEYENATEIEKLALEKRYGKNHIQRMIDDLISEEWLAENSKPCPRCKARIQKSEGCNKMHCSKCQTNFCWLCGKILDERNPYLHFNTWNSPCYNKLFEGVEIDDD